MKTEFIQKVLPNRSKFICLGLNHKDLLHVQDHVMSSLKLGNLNQLRDKFEGVEFQNKFNRKIFPIIALEKELNFDFIDWENLNVKKFEASIYVSGVKINILESEFGNVPVLEVEKPNHSIVTIKNERDIWICGFADKEMMNDSSNFLIVKQNVRGTIHLRKSFIAFDKLKKFSSIDELKKLVTK